jgi:1-acyl-sn-glycerol-3-phosphate acyltransferase
MSLRVEASEAWRSRPAPALVRAVQPFVRAFSRLHPVRLEGVRHLPRGAALLVGNHGLLGYESPLFFERILAACGRLPIGLADRWFFKVPVVRDLLVRLGGTYGSSENGLSELRRGNLVVCYPGGAREVLKEPHLKYRLLWEKSVGFVRLALAAKVPIIPFAAAGVDDTFNVVTRLRGSGELLMGHGKYDLPVVWGPRGPLPNPVPFWFRLGEPIEAPAKASHDDEGAVRELHQEVWTRTQAMVDDLVAQWTDSGAAPKRAA